MHQNIKEQLLMKQQGQEPMPNEHGLPYLPVDTEGQCILKSIVPIKFNKMRYNLFCVVSVFLLGIPVVLAYWYPKFKLKLYYDECHYEDCTHFAVLNYDNQITIVERREENQGPAPQSEQDQQMRNRIQNFHQLSQTKSIYFINRYMKYHLVHEGGHALVRADIYDYESGIRKMLNQNYTSHKQFHGHDEQRVVELRKRFGPGTMIIQRPGLGVLFFRQIVRPLYFFIIATLIIWMNQNYYWYCLVIFVTTAVGIIINLYQTYTLNNKIYAMAYYEVEVNVLISNNVLKISSKEVVPGDVVFLNNPINIPFDGIVLEGSALLNQCALTGESVPVVRKAEDLQELHKITNSLPHKKIPLKNNLICEGTTLIQVDNKKGMLIFEKYRKEYGIPVYVIRTNFVTTKGQLIRIISFPIQKTNIFQKQSARFLIFLFFLAVCSYTILIFRLAKFVKTSDLVIKFLDLITITVPPGLPVSMTFGIIHAIEKLKRKEIFCVSPNKVIMGGLVDMICFDKTGTLTEDYMDFKELVPAVGGVFRQHIPNIHHQDEQLHVKTTIEKVIEQNSFLDHALTNMATNHTIVNVISSGENVGDPMELKLFQFGDYQFSDAIINHNIGQRVHQEGQQIIFGFDSKRGHHGVVVRRMDFDSQLLRMSVITKSSIKQNPDQYYLYTKGSPEVMCEICKPETLPQNYAEVLKEYASHGLRVLAIGHRLVSREQLSHERIAIESNIQFDGFEIFENKLKPETKAAVMQLRNAKIPCVMITGDNSLTGSNISYKCGIADRRKKMFIFNYNEHDQHLQIQQFKYSPSASDAKDDEQQNAEELNAIDNYNKQKNIQMQNILKQMEVHHQNMPGKQAIVLNNRKPTQAQITQYAFTQVKFKMTNPQNQICLTGASFNLFFGNIKLDEMDETRKSILRATKVYARAKPNDKTRIVMSYQQGLGKVVSMCGDGANDCGALKQSDAGLSLSQSEASISAPFTSKVVNISSMVELIKQCRAGLVTNFSLFNIMALYSLIQYSSAVLCQYYYTYPADFSFLYWDIFGNFLFFMAFGYTGTIEVLSDMKPARSLLTFTNLLQVVVMLIIQLIGQLFMLFSISHIFNDQMQYDQKGGEAINREKYIADDDTFVTSSPETNVLFLFANFMYIFSFIAFSISKPWRKQFYTNIPFMVVFVISFTYSILLVVVPSARLSVFQINFMDHSLVNLYVLLVALMFGMLMYINQKFILQPFSAKLRLKYSHKFWI